MEFCRQHDIVIVGYCPIGSSRDASWYVSFIRFSREASYFKEEVPPHVILLWIHRAHCCYHWHVPQKVETSVIHWIYQVKTYPSATSQPIMWHRYFIHLTKSFTLAKHKNVWLCFRVNLKCPPLLEDELLVSIGRKYNKSSAQVALRFNVQRGVVVIPKSFNPERIKHNFQVY